MSLHQIKMPSLGEGVLEGIIRKIYKKKGDLVEADEVVFQVETDKTLVDVESFEQGVVKTCFASEGDTVKIGDVIFELALDNEQNKKSKGHPTLNISDKLINYGLAKGLSVETLKSIVPKKDKLSIFDIEDYIRHSNESDLYEFGEGQLSFISSMEKSKKWQNATWVSTKVQVDSLRALLDKHKHLKKSFISDLQILSYYIAQSCEVLDNKLKLICTGEKKYKANDSVCLSFAALTANKELKSFVLPNADCLSFEAFLESYQQNYASFMENKTLTHSQKPSLYISYLGNEGPMMAVSSLTFPSVATLFIGRKYSENNKTYINLVITFDHNVINGHEAILFLNKIKELVEPKSDIDASVIDFNTLNNKEECLVWLKNLLFNRFGLKIIEGTALGEQSVDSLKAVQIIDEINKQLNLSLPVITLWHYPQIDKLAEHLFSTICGHKIKPEKLTATSHNQSISSILASKVRDINES